MDYIIIDKSTTFIDDKSVIEEGVIIYPFTVIVSSNIEKGSVIKSFSHIENSCVKSGATIFASVIESSTVGENAIIGPFSHLRPNSTIGQNAKIGNFVEIKNSLVGDKTKVSHLSYVGDASIGKEVNIGCGVVFVNFNGKTKNRTSVGDQSFIGSSVNLIAPVKVGRRAFVCAGTTVDKDVSDNDFVIGRSRMQIKPNRAQEYLKGE